MRTHNAILESLKLSKVDEVPANIAKDPKQFFDYIVTKYGEDIIYGDGGGRYDHAVELTKRLAKLMGKDYKEVLNDVMSAVPEEVKVKVEDSIIEANKKFQGESDFKEVIHIKGEYTKGKGMKMEYIPFQLFQVDGKYYEVANKNYIPNASNFYSAVGNPAKMPTNAVDVKKTPITKF